MPAEPVESPVPSVSRGVAAVLPFLYVAWADGLLTPAQAAALRARFEGEPWLSDADRAQLARWLDPEHPPSVAEYHGWMRAVREAARHVPADARPGLAELGIALGRLAGEGAAPSPEERQALERIEEVLGTVGREAVRDLVAPSGDGAVGTPPVSPPSADVAALKAALDESHAALRDHVRALLAERFFAHPDPEWPRERQRAWTFERLQKLADEGLGALAYPEYAGGQNDIGLFVAAFETLAYGDLSLLIKFGVQFGLFGGSINGLGGEAQRRKYLPDVATCALPGCFAMTERLHGSNVRDLRTTATYDAATDEFVIQTPTEHDHKEWIGNAARDGRMATVFAQLHIGEENHGVHAFLVPIRDESGRPMSGVRIQDSGHKMGLNGVDNGRLWFDGVRVPREDLLDRFAQVGSGGVYSSPIPSAGARFFTMLGTLVGGRIAVASAGVSVAKSALAIAVRYGDRRRQFGPKGGAEAPILDNLSHQRRLLPLVAKTYGLNFALHDLAERFSARANDDELRATEAEAAALKAMATGHATRTAQEAREACGGEGYRASNRIAALKADSDVFTTFEGDNTVLMLQVSKGLLGDYRQAFSNLDFFGLVGVLRERVETFVGEPNPLVRRETDERHLLDPRLHLHLFVRRERDLLGSAARRLKARLDRGMDSFDAFVEVQDHLLTLAHAHAERVVLERFQAAVAAAEEARVRETLGRLCALYALAALERERGWFLEENYLDAPKAKAIRAEVNALCRALRPAAVELVDAFAIPDAVLAAPIALEG